MTIPSKTVIMKVFLTSVEVYVNLLIINFFMHSKLSLKKGEFGISFINFSVTKKIDSKNYWLVIFFVTVSGKQIKQL